MSLAERRHKLIEAALRVIGSEGVPAATTRAIAAEAGMPLASFHYAFESHQNLMGEAMSALMGDELADQRALQVRGSSVEEVVRTVLTTHLDDLLRRPAVHRSLLELGDYALRTEGLRQVPIDWRAQRAEQLTLALERHGRAAGVRWPGAVGDFAQCLLVLSDGLTRTYLTTQDEALARTVVVTCSGLFGRAAA